MSRLVKSSMVRVVGWDDFPKDLGAEILARLPLECVYGYRRVSHEWNALLSSTYFLTEKWAEAPIHNKPSLILCDGKFKRSCMAFCFHTWNWKACFSLAFLKQLPCVSVNCRDSAAGLALVDFVSYGHDMSLRVRAIVCNPYTRMFIELDDLPIETKIIDICIVVDENNSNNNNRSDTCKVVALDRRRVTRDESRLFVEICDCSERRWETMGCLPYDFQVLQELMLPELILPELILPEEWNRAMVFCEGSLYMLGKKPGVRRCVIVWFNMPSTSKSRKGMSPIPMFHAPLPLRFRNSREVIFPLLVTCGSRLLLVAARLLLSTPLRHFGRVGSFVPQLTEGEIIMWEFENDHRHVFSSDSESESNSNSNSWKWKEIAKMPSSLFQDLFIMRITSGLINYSALRRVLRITSGLINLQPPLIMDMFKCIGVGENVCFITYKEMLEVVVYNLSQNSWTWLPSCPNKEFKFSTVNPIALKARPDMKVK